MTDARERAIRATDELWRLNEAWLQSAITGGKMHGSSEAAARLVEIRDTAREARQDLEALGDRGESEGVRQARVMFKVLEVGSDLLAYSWVGGHCGTELTEWTRMTGEAAGKLPVLRQMLESEG
jgi:hypothetical protein